MIGIPLRELSFLNLCIDYRKQVSNVLLLMCPMQTCLQICLLACQLQSAGWQVPAFLAGIPSAWSLHVQPSVWPDGRFSGKTFLIFNSRCASRMLVNILQHSVYANLSKSLYRKEPKARHSQARFECLTVLQRPSIHSSPGQRWCSHERK